MDEHDDFEKVCNQTVKEFLMRLPQEFDEELLMVMLECRTICHLYGWPYPGHREIGFRCVSICLECLNYPSADKEYLQRKLEEIKQIVHLGSEHFAP